jgi:hypothetical protein
MTAVVYESHCATSDKAGEQAEKAGPKTCLGKVELHEKHLRHLRTDIERTGGALPGCGTMHDASSTPTALGMIPLTVT